VLRDYPRPTTAEKVSLNPFPARCRARSMKQARPERDHLDLNLLADVVVLHDIRRVVQGQIHRRRIVGINLQDQAMLLLFSRGSLRL
jgi:hypothetical protein